MSRTDKTEQIARSVGRQLGDEQLVDKLARLLPWELNALLLAVYRTHGERHAFPAVAERFAESKTFAVSAADARALHTLNAWFEDAACGHKGVFEAVALAPVAPHGLAALTGIDPNNVVMGTRGAEVLADPTAAMALEIARRMRERRTAGHSSGPGTSEALATCARVLRMQPLPTGPGTEHYSQHFALCALATGVRTRDEIVRAIVEHFCVYLRVIEQARECQWDVQLARLEMAGDRALYESVHAVAREHEELANVLVVFADERTQGRGYYRDCLVRVVVTFPSSARDGTRDESFIGDGGVVDWTGRIFSDAKERLVTSGFGAELFVKRSLRGGAPR